MFEHRFLPLKMMIHLGTPPPTLKNNHRVCENNAMLAFPQEQISHYTTVFKAFFLKQIYSEMYQISKLNN